MNGADLSSVAARLIARYGAPMSFARMTDPAYDPSTGTVSGSESEIAVTGITESIEARFAGGLVQSGDLLVSISPGALGATRPMPGDRLLVEARWHDIVDVNTVSVSGAPVLYRLLVRR